KKEKSQRLAPRLRCLNDLSRIDREEQGRSEPAEAIKDQYAAKIDERCCRASSHDVESGHCWQGKPGPSIKTRQDNRVEGTNGRLPVRRYSIAFNNTYCFGGVVPPTQ